MKLSEFKKKISEKLLKKIKKVFGLKSPSIEMLEGRIEIMNDDEDKGK